MVHFIYFITITSRSESRFIRWGVTWLRQVDHQQWWLPRITHMFSVYSHCSLITAHYPRAFGWQNNIVFPAILSWHRQEKRSEVRTTSRDGRFLKQQGPLRISEQTGCEDFLIEHVPVVASYCLSVWLKDSWYLLTFPSGLCGSSGNVLNWSHLTVPPIMIARGNFPLWAKEHRTIWYDTSVTVLMREVNHSCNCSSDKLKDQV